MTPQTLTFSANPAQVQKLLAELRAGGSKIVTQPDGAYEIKGHTVLGPIEVIARYTNPVLVVIVMKHGWNPMGKIVAEIREHLEDENVTGA